MQDELLPPPLSPPRRAHNQVHFPQLISVAIIHLLLKFLINGVFIVCVFLNKINKTLTHWQRRRCERFVTLLIGNSLVKDINS